MESWFFKLGKAFSHVVHGSDYHRQLERLIKEEARLTREGKNPEKSRELHMLERKCRELAHKQGIDHHPG